MGRNFGLRRVCLIGLALIGAYGLWPSPVFTRQANFFPVRLYVDDQLVMQTQGFLLGTALMTPVIALSSAGWAVTVDPTNGVIDLTDCLRVRVGDRRLFFKVIPAGGPRLVAFSRVFLPAAPILVRGRFYVPVLQLYEFLGFRVSWNRPERTVRVDTLDALKRVGPDRERCTNELLMRRR
jgi:hypothetical protein